MHLSHTQTQTETETHTYTPTHTSAHTSIIWMHVPRDREYERERERERERETLGMHTCTHAYPRAKYRHFFECVLLCILKKGGVWRGNGASSVSTKH
jgi:hypothetical protein